MKKLTKAQQFCLKVKDLAREYNLPFFVVTDGASAIVNKNCKAVCHARKAHIQWEKENEIDSHHDWEKQAKIKKINFPREEISQLKNKKHIVTTRVSKEYNCYHINDILKTPWGKCYIVEKVQKVDTVKNHPYYHYLTKEQIKLISKYKRIDVVALKEYKLKI